MRCKQRCWKLQQVGVQCMRCCVQAPAAQERPPSMIWWPTSATTARRARAATGCTSTARRRSSGTSHRQLSSDQWSCCSCERMERTTELINVRVAYHLAELVQGHLLKTVAQTLSSNLTLRLARVSQVRSAGPTGHRVPPADGRALRDVLSGLAIAGAGPGSGKGAQQTMTRHASSACGS